jgi:hypothetical protein
VVHDAAGHTTVSDLTLVDVSKPEAVAALLAQAMDKRAVGCTALNEQSSRSHMASFGWFGSRLPCHRRSSACIAVALPLSSSSHPLKAAPASLVAGAGVHPEDRGAQRQQPAEGHRSAAPH